MRDYFKEALISKDDMEKIDSINNDEKMKPQAYENLYKVTKKEIV